MKVILQSDVKDQGKKGDLVDVSDGYARNYLFPRKLAAPATPDALNAYKIKEESKAHRLKAERAEAERLAAEIRGKVVKITAKGGTAGRLFGSITSKELSEALKAQHGYDIDKKSLNLKEPIKTAGLHAVSVKLGYEQSAEMTVEVAVE